jgi:GT2 family glycosyltransferase
MAEFHILSIIIVNWNSASFTKACLNKLYHEAPSIPVEIIVIDNASCDGCAEMISSDFPTVLFIQSKQNLGFSAANNLAFERSTGDVVLFLNPDTEVFEGALEKMIEVVLKNSDAGIVGARLLNTDRTVQTSCIQKFPSITGIVLDCNLLRHWLPRWSLWGMWPLFAKRLAPTEVDIISGACQMMRREVFERAGMYSTAYFMYAEDADLCFKINRMGFRNLYVPEAVVMHHGGQSGNAIPVSGWSAIQMRESLKCFFEQHRGRQYAQLFQAAVVLQAALRVIVISSVILATRILGREEKLSLVKEKWKSILRWSLGLERWINSPDTN